MKTLFVLTLFVLVASCYAAPLSVLLSSLKEAEIESILNAELQGYDDRKKGDAIDDQKNDDYNIELQSYQDAVMQGYDDRTKGDGVDDSKNDDYNVLAQGYDVQTKKESVENQDYIVNMQEGDDDDDEGGDREFAALLAKIQDGDDDDDDDSDGLNELEDKMLQAKLQGWKKIKSFGSKIYNGAKKLASNPTVRGLAKNIAGKYLGSDSSQGGERELAELLAKIQDGDDDDDDDSDGIAELLATMQDGDDDDDDDGIAELEAMLEKARLQKWSSFTSKLKSIGSKVASGVKKIASNPIVKSIAKKVIDKYSPIPLPTNERDEQIEKLLEEALME